MYKDHNFLVGNDNILAHNGCAENAIKAIKNGLYRTTVKTRDDAAAVLRELYVGGKKPIRNSADFNSTGAKKHFNSDESYYHWDDEWVYNEKFGGYHLKNHDPFTDKDAFTPHLQIHDKEKGKVIKVFFEGKPPTK